MGVYIKGMEMPKSCGNCFFDTRCDNWRLRNWGAPPPDNCPLVPVPPHGDLIDRDALEVHDGWMNEDRERNVQQTHITFVYSNDIATAPTIISAEEGET